MNVYDFPDQFNEEHLSKIYELIFDRQEQLAQKYTPLEHQNGLRWTQDMPVNIHDGKGQAQLKDMAWRTMEEIGESLEAWFDDSENVETQNEQLLHAKEELADGLHFLTELGILSGIKHTDINISLEKVVHQAKEVVSIDEAVTDFVLRLGITMNCLKNKPWKCSQYPTDEAKFKKHYLLAYEAYIVLMLEIMEPLEILNLYFRKSNVNQFRIESKY
ncbi:MAG TPA: dUTP diphosphatase [Candidatus Nanoarchaeia archaeon]|nr:dUTP diphosphatase [Candidatus Nanoarchaeia archaeon]